jgi:hypothetical protein
MSKHEMLYIAIAVIVVVAIVVIVMRANQRRKSNQLRGTFGSEYDRAVETRGDRRAAEQDLAGRVNRREQFNIRPLAPEARQRYEQSWLAVQAGFVDTPQQSVRQADVLVTQVMTERGYPMAEFDQRASDISVDHGDVVENYRSAHNISVAADQNRASTEHLRQAMTHYRALFDRLLNTGDAQPESAVGYGAQEAGVPEARR